MRPVVSSIACVTIGMLLVSCKSGPSSTSSPSAPSAPSASALCSPPVVATCFAGGLPGFGQVTLTAGGAPSCRVALNEAIPISFTIANPDSSLSWEIQVNPARHFVSPSSGSAGTAGPFQATAQFTNFRDNNGDDTIYFRMSNNTGGCTVPIYGHK